MRPRGRRRAASNGCTAGAFVTTRRPCCCAYWYTSYYHVSLSFSVQAVFVSAMLGAKVDAEVLVDRAAALLAECYTHSLFVRATNHRVVVVADDAVPTAVLAAVERALSGYLRVPSVAHLPCAAAAVMSAGTWSGLVVDVGEHDTRVAPVIDGRMLLGHRSRAVLPAGAAAARAALAAGLCVSACSAASGDDSSAALTPSAPSPLSHVASSLGAWLASAASTAASAGAAAAATATGGAIAASDSGWTAPVTQPPVPAAVAAGWVGAPHAAVSAPLHTASVSQQTWRPDHAPGGGAARHDGDAAAADALRRVMSALPAPLAGATVSSVVTAASGAPTSRSAADASMLMLQLRLERLVNAPALSSSDGGDLAAAGRLPLRDWVAQAADELVAVPHATLEAAVQTLLLAACSEAAVGDAATAAAGGQSVCGEMMRWAELVLLENATCPALPLGAADAASMVVQLPVPPLVLRSLAVSQGNPATAATADVVLPVDASLLSSCVEEPFFRKPTPSAVCASRATASGVDDAAPPVRTAVLSTPQRLLLGCAALCTAYARGAGAEAAAVALDSDGAVLPAAAPLPAAVVRCLLAAPIDARRLLAANLVLCGGVASVPGFAARLLVEACAASDPSLPVAEHADRLISRSSSTSAGPAAVPALMSHHGVGSAAPLVPLLGYAGLHHPFTAAWAGASAFALAASTVSRAVSTRDGSAGAAAAVLTSSTGMVDLLTMLSDAPAVVVPVAAPPAAAAPLADTAAADPSGAPAAGTSKAASMAKLLALRDQLRAKAGKPPAAGSS